MVVSCCQLQIKTFDSGYAATVHQKTKNVQTINLQKQIEINATYEAAMMQHTNNRTPLQMQLMLQTNSK